MTQIITLCNQKGGVGKTTTTYHLARAAHLAGRRTLVVDLDPQGNTTTFLTQDVAEDQISIADALLNQATLTDIVVPGIWEHITVAPTAGETLTIARDQLTIDGAGSETRLRDLLADTDAEIVLIDCGPSLDSLTTNALTAADQAVIVTQSQTAAVLGLVRLRETIERIATSYNPDLRLAGVIVNQHEAQTLGATQVIADLEDAQLPLLEPYIPKTVALRDAMDAGYGLDQWSGRLARSLSDRYTSYLRELTA